jgi:hypothetical protein
MRQKILYIAIFVIIVIIIYVLIYQKYYNVNNIKNINNTCTISNYDKINLSEMLDFMNNNDNYSLCDINVFNFMKNNCKGDGIIIGVWKGGLAIWTKYHMDKKSNLYLFDTFEEGFKSQNKFEEYPFFKIKDVKNNFKKFGVSDENTFYIKGDIQNTYKNIYNSAIKKVNFVYIDVDLYYPTMYSLVGTHKILKNDGVCAVDDYDFPHFDAKKAVDTFMKWYGIKKYSKINQYAIYWKKEKQLFDYTEDNLIYNFFAIYNKQDNNIFMSSSDIFEMVLKYYDMNSSLIKFTQSLQKYVGINNTIWGVKKEKNTKYISLEYYFYGWDKYDPGKINDLYNNKCNVNHVNKFFNKYFNKNITFDERIKNNTVIYSIDITNDMFNTKELNNKVHMYCHKEKNINNKLSYNSGLITYEYDYVNNSIILESESETFKVDENNWENIKDNILEKKYNIINHHEKLKKYYINSKYFAILDKHMKKKLGIYFHCININSFIDFLTIGNFEKDFIDYFVFHEYFLQNLSFEIAMDYDPYTHELTKFAFYGSI